MDSHLSITVDLRRDFLELLLLWVSGFSLELCSDNKTFLIQLVLIDLIIFSLINSDCVMVIVCLFDL